MVKIRAATLDDILYEAFERLLRTGRVVTASKGKNRESSGVVIELTNPRARMSRSEARHLLFGCLGELLWYLSGDDTLSFIRYYLPNYEADGVGVPTVRAAYGPRLRNETRDQITWVVEMLQEKPTTRRAVIPVYALEDTDKRHPEVPCTCTLQFLLRNERLELLTHMRSNDVYRGLPGDVFAFTMIQELVARALDVEVGRYKHLVGSLHLYEGDFRKAKRFLAEGWQQKHSMPNMPLGDQFAHLKLVLKLEAALRKGGDPRIPAALPEYWRDIVQLLRIHKADIESASSKDIKRLRKAMHSDAYEPYIETKQRRAQKRERQSESAVFGDTLFPM